MTKIPELPKVNYGLNDTASFFLLFGILLVGIPLIVFGFLLLRNHFHKVKWEEVAGPLIFPAVIGLIFIFGALVGNSSRITEQKKDRKEAKVALAKEKRFFADMAGIQDLEKIFDYSFRNHYIEYARTDEYICRANVIRVGNRWFAVETSAACTLYKGNR